MAERGRGAGEKAPPEKGPPARAPATRGVSAPSSAKREGEANAVALRVALGQPAGAAPPSPGALAEQARRQAEDAPSAPPSGDGGMRQKVGRALGRDLSGVRLHTGAEAASRTEAAGAHAAAQGGDVWFAPGRFRPDRPLGRALIAHELVHAAQQGAVPPLAGVEEEHDAVQGELQGLTPAPPGTLSLFACGGGETVAEDEDLEKAAGEADTTAPATPPTTPPTPATPAPPPRISTVEDVRSLHVEENLDRGVAGAGAELEKRLRQRLEAIESVLAAEKPGSKRAETLIKLKQKSLQEILDTPDTIISAAFRTDVISAKAKLDKRTLERDVAEKQFHRYDTFFNDPAVSTALTGTGFTPADLKALIAQESGDLVKEDKGKGIAGIAQLGPVEEKEAGGAAGDRNDPEKAILLAAKLLKIKSDRLNRVLTRIPTGDEYRRFLIASYNAGEKTISDAQAIAIGMKRPGTAWSDLITANAGGVDATDSPFSQSVKTNLSKLDPATKYDETVLKYVPRIEKRVTPR
jgi:soluble lytic murein transglycosylase-like protein